MVMDVVESVRLMEQDEDSFVRRWQAVVSEIEERLLPLHGGRIVKSLGDGLMLEFSDAQSCVRFGMGILEFARHAGAGQREEHRLQLRLGAHSASFVVDKHDIYGTDVNLTARVATLAGPGEMVVTASVRDHITATLDADIDDLGECYLKHVKEPVRAYRVEPVGRVPIATASKLPQLDLRPTVAVIPFTTRAADLQQEMLGEALADEVIAGLSRTEAMHVISRLSTAAFRGRTGAVEDIRDHLNADYILSGTCRSSGDAFSLFVELIDAKSKKVVWADSLKGKVHGVFETDDDLIARLVASVSSAMVRQELYRADRHALPTLQGYTLLLGSVAMMHRTQLSDFDRAREMLEHLVDRSRRHPAPFAWLAYWHVMRVQQGWTDSAEKETKLAANWASRALDNDPNSTLALTVDGLVHTSLMKDPAAGIERYTAALEVNPNESLAWLLKGMAETFSGNAGVGLASAERALQLSPLDPLRYFYDSLGSSIALAASKHERAIELAKRSLRQNRTHTSTYRALAIAQSLLGEMDDARATVQQLLALEPSFTVAEFLRRVPAPSNPLVQSYAAALGRAGVPL